MNVLYLNYFSFVQHDYKIPIMNCLNKIPLLILVISLISCNKQEKLPGTWISAPIDTVYTSWDISNNLIVSNMLSPDRMVARYKIHGNNLVIDSGMVFLDGLYIPENKPLRFRLFRNKLKIKLPTADTIYSFVLSCKPDLSVYERMMPDKLLNVDLPYISYSKTDDITYSDYVFIGFPKKRLLRKFHNQAYLQLNDMLTGPGNPILREFISFVPKNPIVIFCDKGVKMIELDSLRSNLYSCKILFGTLNEDMEIGCLATSPHYYCNCIPEPRISPSKPGHGQCRHSLYPDKKWYENRFRVDSLGKYYLHDTLINIYDIPGLIDLRLKKHNSNEYFFIQYDDFTRFEDYITLYASIMHSFDSIYKHQDIKMTIIDISKKDLRYINNN